MARVGSRNGKALTVLTGEAGKKREIEMTSAKVRAKQVSKYFLRGDDYIAEHNHRFDAIISFLYDGVSSQEKLKRTGWAMMTWKTEW